MSDETLLSALGKGVSLYGSGMLDSLGDRIA
jgi:hypothetical protein